VCSDLEGESGYSITRARPARESTYGDDAVTTKEAWKVGLRGRLANRGQTSSLNREKIRGAAERKSLLGGKSRNVSARTAAGPKNGKPAPLTVDRIEDEMNAI